MAMNMYDTKCSSLSKIKTLYILIQTNFLAPTKTEIELQSQLLKQKPPPPRLWNAQYFITIQMFAITSVSSKMKSLIS